MKKIVNLIDEYYDIFKGLPSYSPIVRNNQVDDAFEIVVLKVLYGKDLDFDFSKGNANKIAQYIIAPPDSGIDIFFEKSNGDDSFFDVIQVKNKPLTESEIKTCFAIMERTIDDYCKDIKSIGSKSCKDILASSNLEKSNKNNCNYLVIHTGDVQDFSGSKDNEKVITLTQLEILLNNVNDKVESQTLSIDRNNNIVNYSLAGQDQKAIICSISGFDLAELNNKYYSTEMGRNILFGQNLREQLNSKKSKTYLGMKKTIDSCPENFWFYNNGITIIAEQFEEVASDSTKITLNNFSIVNGAQTTSSLGLFLKEAQSNHDDTAIDNLKKVFVLTRILQVKNENMRRDIAIYNNTQNPITSRDMVANRDEQKRLSTWLMDENYPQIYVEIRRGAQIPGSFNKGISHRKTTNEELAQLAYAGFYQKPFIAKDKKSALFNNDYSQNEYTLNKIYHDVFHYSADKEEDCGILFKKSKYEIDELLFIQYLYKLCKSELRKSYQTKISEQESLKTETTDSDTLTRIDARITEFSTNLETVGVCMFYFISLYYEFKGLYLKGKKKFITDSFYADKAVKESMVKSASDLFLTLTVKILKKTAKEANKSGNINNWVRGSACQDKFFETLRSELSTEISYEDKYNDFVAKYMTDI